MKKYIIMAILACLVILPGCKKEKKSCWRSDVVYTYLSDEQKTMTLYTWATSLEEVVTGVGSNIALSMVGVKIVSHKTTKVPEYETQEHCEAQNQHVN